MTNWYKVAREQDVTLNTAKCVLVGQTPVAIYHLQQGFFATADTCTHAQASLSEGFIEGDTVECPLHQGIFHIPTGKAMTRPLTDDVPIYELKIENGEIYVGLDD